MKLILPREPLDDSEYIVLADLSRHVVKLNNIVCAPVYFTMDSVPVSAALLTICIVYERSCCTSIHRTADCMYNNCACVCTFYRRFCTSIRCTGYRTAPTTRERRSSSVSSPRRPTRRSTRASCSSAINW